MYAHIIVYNISYIMLDCIYNPWTRTNLTPTAYWKTGKVEATFNIYNPFFLD